MRFPPPTGRYLVASAMAGEGWPCYGPYLEQRKREDGEYVFVRVVKRESGRDEW